MTVEVITGFGINIGPNGEMELGEVRESLKLDKVPKHSPFQHGHMYRNRAGVCRTIQGVSGETVFFITEYKRGGEFATSTTKRNFLRWLKAGGTLIAYGVKVPMR